MPKKGRRGICKLIFRMNQSSGDASIGARYLSDSLRKTRTTKPNHLGDAEDGRGRGKTGVRVTKTGWGMTGVWVERMAG